MVQDFFLTLLDWWRTTVLIRSQKSCPLFKEGELWWCSIGLNIGTEIFGKGNQFARPVLVLKKFNKDSFLGLPLTSKLKIGKWYVPIFYENQERTGVLSQVRTFDGRRLIRKVGTLHDDYLLKVKKVFTAFIMQ